MNECIVTLGKTTYKTELVKIMIVECLRRNQDEPLNHKGLSGRRIRKKSDLTT